MIRIKDLASLVPLTIDKRSLKQKSLGYTIIAGGLNPRYAFEHITEGIEHSKEHFAQDENDIQILLPLRCTRWLNTSLMR